MKNRLLAFALSTVMLLSLTACGKARPVVNETPTTMPQAAAETPATPVPVTPAAEPRRQDGERFDSVIMLEGMEEQVHYEHLVNQTAGFEMDYDYDFFKRKSEADGESFFSVWDDEKVPEKYLEVRHEAKNAQAAADAVSETLSREFEILVPLSTAESVIASTSKLLRSKTPTRCRSICRLCISSRRPTDASWPPPIAILRNRKAFSDAFPTW